MSKPVAAVHPNQDLIALGIRQPWAELILRGIKTLEIRSQDTSVRGSIYIYTSKKLAEIPAANTAARKHEVDLETLPLGVLVGTVEIVESIRCTANDAAAACVPKSYVKNRFGWRLANPQRLAEPLTVQFLPYGVWFYPFKRRNSKRRNSRRD